MGLLDLLGISKGYTPAQAERVSQIFEYGYSTDRPSDYITGRLKDEGLSYRRQEMLLDVRRYGAVINVKNQDERKVGRALDYFDNVVEPYRRDTGLSMSTVWGNIHKKENAVKGLGEYESDEEEIDIEDASGKYGFGYTF